MADEKDVVKDVVEVLHDGHKGFAKLADSQTRCIAPAAVPRSSFLSNAADSGFISVLFSRLRLF